MSFRLPHVFLLLPALLVPAVFAFGWNDGEASAAAVPAAISAEEELEELMHGIDKDFEAVVQSIEKKDAAAALELVLKIQTAGVSAKTMMPPKLRTIEEKDKAAFKVGYRKELNSLLKATADLDNALLDGDMEKAKQVAEQIDALKKSSHEVYKKMPRKKKD
ncbi:MAG: hypothetical protein IPK67_18905 [Planctomycetes bacterium]|nr:hypothetical protein [Planctomycetota bacterium]